MIIKFGRVSLMFSRKLAQVFLRTTVLRVSQYLRLKCCYRTSYMRSIITIAITDIAQQFLVCSFTLPFLGCPTIVPLFSSGFQQPRSCH